MILSSFQKRFFLLLISILYFETINGRLVLGKRDNFHALYLQQQQVLNEEDNAADVWGRNFKESEDTTYIIRDFSEDPNNLRLPLEVIPFHYFLEIIPILEANTSLGKQWTAPGNVKILVEAVKPSKIITLHAVRLNISKVKV